MFSSISFFTFGFSDFFLCLDPDPDLFMAESQPPYFYFSGVIAKSTGNIQKAQKVFNDIEA
jgi:hypothetical protein